MDFASRFLEEAATSYREEFATDAPDLNSSGYSGGATSFPSEWNDDWYRIYDGYVPTTVDPDWWFTICIIAGCFVVNLSLPLWIYLGNRCGFHDKSHRKRIEKSQNEASLHEQPASNEPNTDKNGENDLSRQLNEARSLVSGYSYAPGDEGGSQGPPGSVVSGSIAFSRAGTHLGFNHSPSNLINDDDASIFSGASGFTDAILAARPKRAGRARRRAAKTKTIVGTKSKATDEGSEHTRDRDGGNKKRLDVRMAAEFTKAEMDLLQERNGQGIPTGTLVDITPKTSASEVEYGDGIDDTKSDLGLSVAPSIMSRLDADAISVRDAVDARDGGLPQLEGEIKLANHVAPGSTQSGCILSGWNRLMFIADWDKEMKKYVGLAAHYSAQGILGEIFGVIEIAAIGHFMGVPQANAYIIVETVTGFTGTISTGFYECAGVLIPQADGARNDLMIGRYMQLGIIFYLITMIPGAVFWCFFTDRAVTFYGFDETTAEMGRRYFLATLPGYLTYGVDAVLYELLNTVGRESYCTWFTILSNVSHTGLVVGMLWWGVKDLFFLGAIETASGILFLIINFTILMCRGWLDRYWEGLFKTNGLKDSRAVKNVINTALPLSFAWILTYGEWEVMTFFCRRMGNNGAEVAAWGLMGYIWSAFETLTDGFGDAAEVRVGFRMGAGQVKSARLATDKALYVSLIVAVYATGILFVLAQYIPGWMTPDPTLQRMIFDIIPLIGFSQCLMVWGMVAWAILGAQGRIRIVTALEFFISWGIGAPIAAIFVYMFNYNIEGIIGGLSISYTISTNVYLYMLHTSDWENLSAVVVARSASEGKTYDEFYWDDLPDNIQDAAIELGYNKWIWESDDMEPASNDKFWDELTAAERKSACLLGYTKKTWDCEDETAAQNDSSSSSQTSEASSDEEAWKNLSLEAKNAAKILGYTESIWDNDGSPPTEDLDWDELSPKEQDAAKTLGYDEKKWNGDDDDESADASAGTPQPNEPISRKSLMSGSIQKSSSSSSVSSC